MLFSLLKHYLDTDTALKVSNSVYSFTTSVSHGVENYYLRLWSKDISDTIFFTMVFGCAVRHHWVGSGKKSCTGSFSETIRFREVILCRNIVWGCRCTPSWYGLNLNFELAIVT